MDDLLATILTSSYSLVQLKHRLRILKSYLVQTFFGEVQTLSAPDLHWLKSLPDSFYQQFNKDNVYDICTNLDRQIQQLPILTLYLAFEPDEDIVTQIGLFVRKTFNPTLVLDIKSNPSIIAGTVLVWKGILKDYSLKAKTDSMKGQILQEFKKFLR